MLYCDLTFPSAAENLACDEALLELSETGGGDEVLRFWEPTDHFVVLGYANKAASEVNLSFCSAHSIPVLRRCTGGGTVLQGPGVLNYSLILRIDEHSALHSITSTNQWIMEHHRLALTSTLGRIVEVQGHTDLAIGGLKICGNAQRRGKGFLLFHGSFLLELDVKLMEQALLMPSREPAYRKGRCHSTFLMNLELPADSLRTSLARTWDANRPLDSPPLKRIAELARDKYNTAAWTFRFT